MTNETSLTNDYISVFRRGRLCRIPLDRISVWDNNSSDSKKKSQSYQVDDGNLLANLRKSRESITKDDNEEGSISVNNDAVGFSAVLAYMAKEMEMQKMKKKRG